MQALLQQELSILHQQTTKQYLVFVEFSKVIWKDRHMCDGPFLSHKRSTMSIMNIIKESDFLKKNGVYDTYNSTFPDLLK